MISGEGKYFVLTSFQGSDEEIREQWLAKRREGIGGSDVAAIMGLNEYRSPYQVFADKVLGVTEDLSDNEAVEWGNRLEVLIGEKYAEVHPESKVRRVNGIATSIERPWAQASLDFEVKDPELGWGVLEIKTAGISRAADWEEGVPVYYQTQVAHYLSVTGRPFAYVAVLIAGRKYREYRIMRDEEDIQAVDEAVNDFWHNVIETNTPPETTALDGRTVFESHDKDGRAFAEYDTVPNEVTAWRMAKKASDEAKKDLDEATARLKEFIGDNAGLTCPVGQVKWLRNNRTTIDSKRFKAENPSVYEQYATTKTVDGGLRFKENKEVM